MKQSHCVDIFVQIKFQFFETVRNEIDHPQMKIRSQLNDFFNSANKSLYDSRIIKRQFTCRDYHRQ